MNFNKSKKANINYLAKIVKLDSFVSHNNPEVTRMKCAHVDGYNIIVGIDEQPGLYIYFPANCTINPNLLAFANLYRHGELNNNPEKTGFFNDNGRVTSIKLKGQISEGFLLPFSVLAGFIQQNVNLNISETDVVINTEFDQFEHDDKCIWINKKYVIVRQQGSSSNITKKQKNVRKFNKAIDDQFRFHYDTILVKKDPLCIGPHDIISITEKIHGTSGISAYVLCKKKNTLLMKIKRLLGASDTYYDYLYASRTVIKNATETSNPGGFYKCDVWAEADKIVRPYLQKGMTAYYEIVGYLPTGGYIQKNYDYGCIPPNENEIYTHEKHFKVRIYRLTITNVDGKVHEFSAREVQEWCINTGLVPVKEYYYGYASDLYDELIPELFKSDDKTAWNTAFWDKLANDKTFNMECNSPSCNNKVPHEGVVIKKEDLRSRAWKLKCFKFLSGEAAELDAGIENIEDNA